MDTLKVVPIKRFGVEALSGELASEVSDIERTGMIENPVFPVCLEFTSMEAEIRPRVDEKLKLFLSTLRDETWFVMVFLKTTVEVMPWCIFIEDEA